MKIRLLSLFALLFITMDMIGQGYTPPPTDYRRYRVYQNSLGYGFVNSIALQNQGLSGMGLVYKRFLNKSAITGSFSYDVIAPTLFKTIQQNIGTELRTGFERHMDIGHVMPFLGIEAMTSFRRFHAVDDQDFFEKDRVFNAGASPYAGIQIWMGNRLSMSVRTRLDIYYTNRELQLNTLQNGRIFTNRITTIGMKASYALIGLFIVSYHFS